MSEAASSLRPTRSEDLDEVLALERHPDNVPFIGQWSREEHLAAIANAEREHWIIESRGRRLGYLIAYDLVAGGFGVYVKRIVVAEKSRGIGRTALGAYCRHAFSDLQAPFVWLSVFPENERGQRSYRAVGFNSFEMSPERRAEVMRAVGFSETGLLLVMHPTPAGL